MRPESPGYLLGIDVGTSGCKAVALTLDGTALAAAESRYPMSVPQPGWAEQHPASWWSAVGTVAAELLARVPHGARPLGIGVTGQMHSLVALDERHRVLRPSILWCDRRTQNQAIEISEAVGEAMIMRITRNPSRAAFTASKLQWLREHESPIAERIRHVLLPKDWIVLRLTGEVVTEPSDASGTGLFDAVAGEWSAELLAALGMAPGLFPTVVASSSVVGTLLPEASDELGLPPGLPVIAGAGDQAAAAYDVGATRAGVVACNLGTSVALTESVPLPLEGTLSHVVPGQWLYLTSAHSGTIALDWWGRVGGVRADDVVDLAGKSVPGARGVTFVPLLIGSRDRGHRATSASFHGLREDHTGSDLARAVLEGVALEIRHIATSLPAIEGSERSWRVFGGGIRGPLFVQTIADVLHTELTIVTDASSARGVARLLATGLGLYVPEPFTGDNVVTPQDKFDYDEMYAGYRDSVVEAP